MGSSHAHGAQSLFITPELGVQLQAHNLNRLITRVGQLQAGFSRLLPGNPWEDGPAVDDNRAELHAWGVTFAAAEQLPGFRVVCHLDRQGQCVGHLSAQDGREQDLEFGSCTRVQDALGRFRNKAAPVPELGAVDSRPLDAPFCWHLPRVVQLDSEHLHADKQKERHTFDGRLVSPGVNR